MNHLQHETSPYLLQHAHNPVDWYAWKPEAFEKAQKEDKPILVSIGYSTCHWCHVMERESFEDKEIATYMNDNFVCIKVDREERPDVDQIYMEACQVMTGGGGWPLNCFLTPDKKPFFAGTYYPPMPAYNRPSWLQVLMNISHAYQTKRETVEEQAARLTEIIQNSGDTFTGNNLQVVREGNPFHPAMLQHIFSALERNFDNNNGGFGGAPKFPGTMVLEYLLGYHYHFGEEKALDHVLLSLDKMAMGGIYDQLGGGFSRYATDAKWMVPHFEKMLYDNALLVGVLADAYKLTKKALYQETIEETLEWVRREMTSSEGGFYSAQDADSEGVEGKYYVWEKGEVEEVLGKEASLFCEFYGVTEEGNWEGKSILWREWAFEAFANKKEFDVADLKRRLADSRLKLFVSRDKRIHPGLDDKILLDWNALMASAHAAAYAAVGKEAYREVAVRNIQFILEKMVQPDGISLYHTYKNGAAQYDGFLDDYAFLIDALISVYSITFDTDYLLQAGRYTEFVLQHFLDEEDKMFYFTSSKQLDVPVRKKDLYDSATPSGNSTMVRNLHRLGILLEKGPYRALASEMLLKMKASIERYPSSFGHWSCTLADEVFGIPEIAVLGDRALDMAVGLNKEFLPEKVLMASSREDASFPLLAGKENGNHTLIYVCQNYACQQPVETIEAFKQLLEESKSSYLL
ncbi:MAG: thioredoxin domain-containing protein [Saprospiraceae bacterium]